MYVCVCVCEREREFVVGPSLEVITEEMTRLQKFSTVDIPQLIEILEKVRSSPYCTYSPAPHAMYIMCGRFLCLCTVCACACVCLYPCLTVCPCLPITCVLFFLILCVCECVFFRCGSRRRWVRCSSQPRPQAARRKLTLSSESSASLWSAATNTNNNQRLYKVIKIILFC